MTVVRQTGFTGMRYDLWGDRTPGECYFIENGYPKNPDRPSAIVPRPGIVNEAVGTAAETTQGLLEFTPRTTGTLTKVALINGEIWANATTGSTWTRVITAAQVAGAGITVVADAPVYLLDFAGYLIVADNTNQPWAWDGTSGAGLTLLSNAPASTVGNPTVYYGKLFFIKSNATLVWSEENAPNTGYEAGGYNNAWDLTQTSGAALVALQGTNTALYLFRDYSITYITGTVTPDFASTGTHEGVSSIVGCGSARSVAYDGTTIFFCDRLRRPHALRGLDVIPLWEAVADLYRDGVLPFETNEGAATNVAAIQSSQVYWNKPITAFSPATGHVLFFITNAANGNYRVFREAIVYHAGTLACHGFWWWQFTGGGAGYTAFAVGTRWGAANTPSRSLMMGQLAGTQARISFLGEAELITGLVDTPVTTAIYVPVRIITGPLGWNEGTIVFADRAEVTATISGTTALYHKVKLRVLTPDAPSDHGASAPSYQTLSTAGKATWGTAEARLPFGVNAQGRWLALDISATMYTTGDVAAALRRFQLHGVTVDLKAATREPARR